MSWGQIVELFLKGSDCIGYRWYHMRYETLLRISSADEASRYITYSHRGFRTKPRSSILLWGMTRRSCSTTCLPYIKISRSMVRGPFSTVFILPRWSSICLRVSSNSNGPSELSTYKGRCYWTSPRTLDSTHLTCAIDERLLVF